MNKLTIILSGSKQSGKSSLAKFILTHFINSKIKQERFALDKFGSETIIIDQLKNDNIVYVDGDTPDSQNIASAYSVKVYSFADPLKNICTQVLGLDHAQCYGSDDDKNSKTHVAWDDLPYEIREKYAKSNKKNAIATPRKGPMSGREVMQILGTDIFRKMDQTCWARALYNTIEKDGHSLAIITDARFPNEVTMGTESGGKAIRLMRQPFEDLHESEMALHPSNFPLAEYNYVLNNEDLSMKEAHNTIKSTINTWFKDYGVI